MSISYFPSDLKRVTRSDRFFVWLKWFIFGHALHLTLLIRIGQSMMMLPLLNKFLVPLCELFIRIIYASDISCRAKIGPGLIIVHGHDIVIGANVIIGEDCKIFNGVTLGNKYTEVPDNAQPTVGNGVVISTGAKVLGGIQIGNHTMIGANCVVLTDCPPGAVVVGVPGRVIRVNPV